MSYFNPIRNRLNGAAWISSIADLDAQIESILARLPVAYGFDATALFAPGAPKAARWRESEQAYMARLDLPGLRTADIVLELRGDEIAVSAERRETTGEGADKVERVYCYRRRVPVPEGTDVDSISASYEGGVLSVTLPKAEQAKPRVIKVKGD